MKALLPSGVWTQAAVAGIDSSEACKHAACTWESITGKTKTVQADSSLGIAENCSVFFDRLHDECRVRCVANAQPIELARFTISTHVFTQRQVLADKLELVTGLMRGKLNLLRINMVTLARYVLVAKELVYAATQIGMEFLGA